jgi:hypothetical protein
MKTPALRSLILACSILGLSGALQAQKIPPKQIRVQAEFIEVSHEQFTELMFGEKVAANDAELRKQLAQLVKDGKASIIETMLCVTDSGQKATTESIEEIIYPTEYEPADGGASLDSYFKKDDDQPFDWKNIIASATGPTPTAFETRNAGVTFEVEPKVSSVSPQIKLVLDYGIVTPVRIDLIDSYRDRWGDASVRMPVYESWNSKSTVSVTPGAFNLVTVIHPKPVNPTPAVSRRILVFVRADILAEP